MAKTQTEAEKARRKAALAERRQKEKEEDEKATQKADKQIEDDLKKVARSKTDKLLILVRKQAERAFEKNPNAKYKVKLQKIGGKKRTASNAIRR